MSKKDKKEDIIEDQIEAQEVDVLSVEEKLQEDLQKEKDKFLRLFAEFENYKKRTTKERIELFTTASQDLMLSMLPVLDDFERALGHIEEDKEAEDLRKGVMLIYNKLLASLKQKGLKEMESKGKPFDSDFHQAITEIEVPNMKMKGKVFDVVEKGYFIGDKILRHAKVVVGK